MKKKALITGAAGFLGSHLAKDLLDADYIVVGMDNLCSGKMTNLEKLPPDRFTFIEMDVSSAHAVTHPAVQDVSEIFHLASPASPKYYQSAPFDTINVNTIGTKNMLELAVKTNSKMVYTSTSEAYGDPEVHPQPEHYRGNVNTWGPRACYDESKRLGEVLCYEFYQRYQTKVKVARIFNTYSAGLANDDGRVISSFVTQALTGNDITVYGAGTQTRSFCYVTDTIKALKLLMEKDEANGQIINIGSPVEYKILDLALMVKELTASVSNITFHPLPVDDPKVRRPDISKAKTILGWEPSVDLEQGLKYTIDEYRLKLNK